MIFFAAPTDYITIRRSIFCSFLCGEHLAAHLSPAEDERELDCAELLGKKVEAEVVVDVELVLDAGEQRVHVLFDAGVEQHALGVQRGPGAWGRHGGGSTRVVVVRHDDVDCGVLVDVCVCHLCVRRYLSLCTCVIFCAFRCLFLPFWYRTLVSVCISKPLAEQRSN